MRNAAWILLCSFGLACAPDETLPGPGSCDVDVSAVEPPRAETIALGGPASFDDLTWSEALGRVIAVPQGTGALYLVEPETKDVVAFDGLASGIASADAIASRVFVADRGNRRVLAVDAESGGIVQFVETAATPDYVRVTPGGGELWVTEPGADAIEVFAIADDGELAAGGRVDVVGGPEGLTFDGELAYTQRFDGTLVAIEIAGREVAGAWASGCSGAHGFPQSDGARGLAFAGCSRRGGASVIDATEGRAVAGFEAGGDAAILAYDASLGHLYLRGDPGGDLAILGVCESGELGELATVELSEEGHGMTTDRTGNVFVADATTGGLLRVVDPYAP